MIPAFVSQKLFLEDFRHIVGQLYLQQIVSAIPYYVLKIEFQASILDAFIHSVNS